MEKITQKELDKTIEKHRLWLRGDENGEKADLSYFDLSHTDLSGADLQSANLCHANLEYSNLSHVDLRFSNLRYVNMTECNLMCANFRRSILRGASLQNADIRGANLYNSNLTGAKLDGVITDDNTQYFNLRCPEEGSFVGWKKAKTIAGGHVLVKLLIPADAKRSSATTNKCRASKAKVLEMVSINTHQEVKVAYSCHFQAFEYRIGEYVYPDSFDEDRFAECSHGIHFFMTEDEALDY